MHSDLEEWWDERVIGGTLWDMLPTAINAPSCCVKLLKVKYETYERILLDFGVITHHRFNCTKTL